MHGSDFPFWSSPVPEMGPNIKGLYGEVIEAGVNWKKCDEILMQTLGPLEKPWYFPRSYCPFGLPNNELGLWYTRRYHLCLLAIAELMEEDPSVGQSQPVVVIDGDPNTIPPPTLANRWLACALFSHDLIFLRARYLQIPHSFIYWSKRRKKWWTRFTNTEHEERSTSRSPSRQDDGQDSSTSSPSRSPSPSRAESSNA